LISLDIPIYNFEKIFFFEGAKRKTQRLNNSTEIPEDLVFFSKINRYVVYCTIINHTPIAKIV